MPETTELTLERLHRIVTECGYNCDINESALVATFNGFATAFTISAGGVVLTITVWSSGHFTDPNRLPEATVWANTFNRDFVFGVASPYVDDEGDLMMKTNSSLIISSGITDEQVAEFTTISLPVIVGAMEKYVSHMGLR